MAAVAYVDRLYADPDDGRQPWPRLRRFGDEPTWEAACDYGSADRFEEGGGFETVEEAISWARDRAEVVLVRLGNSVDAMYSAGSRDAVDRIGATEWHFPPWPPSTWPNYTGTPEPGWPEYPDDPGET